MFLHKYLTLSIVSLILITVKTEDIGFVSNVLNETISLQNLEEDLYLIEEKIQTPIEERVDIKLYYECLCPDCRTFDTLAFKSTVEKLASNLDLNLYPYGNAQTIDNGNGTYIFKCQHGPDECYGNKLHACAIQILGNITKAVFFNSCLMDYSQSNRGSNDEAANKCGKSLDVDSDAIKQCAKGPEGNSLLKNYGDESKKAGFRYVPYILINGVVNDGNNFMRDVCAAFTYPPAACEQMNQNSK